MDLIRLAIAKPVGVTVGVLIVVMFGLIGLGAIPIQLTPTVDAPIIKVETSWPGRSPEEIIDEITKEQEEVLKNVDGLKSMISTTSEGTSTINLEFFLGASIERALQEVSDSLRQVPDYPDEVNEPTIEATEAAADNAIAWIIVDVAPEARARHPNFDITTLFDRLDKDVRPILERVEGVAEVNVYGGREREVRVYVDTAALAQRSITPNQVVEALQAENRNTSAGTIAEGKRDIRIRVVGKFTTAEQVLSTIIAYRDAKPVYVRDVATVDVGHTKRRGFVRSLGTPSIAINVIRQADANVMKIMHGDGDKPGVRDQLDAIRADILPAIDPVVGADLRIRQVYDETTYITSAISLVTQNLWIGGTLAAFVLLLFLRSFVSTGVIALAIPISVIGTFLALLALGRTLNVVSLAGLAFAVGMVVDNAIVVLENIYRRLRGGEKPMEAAYNGAREVWGAVLASTLTTVAVFIPVLTIQEEAGQLFRDIALAVVCSVILSLIISITVIPAACSRWLRTPTKHGRLRTAWDELFGLAPLLGMGGRLLGAQIAWLSSGWRGWTLRPLIIVVMTGLSVFGAAKLMPPMDYLPAGNRNLVFGGLQIPPGLSVEERVAIAERLEAHVKPYMDVDPDDPEKVAQLPQIPMPWGPPGMPGFDPVAVDNFFIGAFGDGMFTGATSAKEEVVIPVGHLLTNAIGTVPDTYGGAGQSSLFGRGVGGGGTIDVEISGPDLNRVLAAADAIFNTAGRVYGFGRAVSASPSNFNLRQPEYQVELNQVGRELGLTTRDLGTSVRALFDGAFAGEFFLDGETVDIVLLPEGGKLQYKEQLAAIPVSTPTGRTVPLDTVVNVRAALAPQAIQRIEELPSVTIAIRPPSGAALEEVMDQLRAEVIAPVREQGLITEAMRVRLEGTAAQLDEVRGALFGAADDASAPVAWRRPAEVAGLVVFVGGLLIGGICLVRSVRKRSGLMAYGVPGALLIAGVIGLLMLAVGEAPQLATARFIWALLVTYLLMCALFESFIYPFVIMFSVPLALVGGFAGLKIVHDMTVANPTIAAQNLDVLTMLGFVILIGVVVNNAILLVHQALSAMRGTNGTAPKSLDEAIGWAVTTRIRPIFMSTLTSVGGMLPLVLFPGAGSEMYRGLGSVVVGGLLVATFFTLLLVPLLFGLVVRMSQGLRLALGLRTELVIEAPARAGTMELSNGAGSVQNSNGSAPAAPQPARPPVKAVAGEGWNPEASSGV